MPKAEVHLCSYRGIWTPQHKVYFSQSSKILVSRHPLEVVEEILYTYCPQCFSRFSEDDACDSGNVCPACKQCPRCDGMVVSKSADSPPVCTTCMFVPASETSIARSNLQQDAYAALLTQYQSLTKKKTAHGSEEATTDSRWKMSDLEHKLADNQSKQGETVDILSSHRQCRSEDESIEKAVGVRLRSKRTVRCRKDLEEGKLNILVQPKPYPLDGDSSMKLQTGDWWVKDSSAIHFIPFITILELPKEDDMVHQQWSSIKIRFRNPKDSPASIRFVSHETLPLQEDYVFVGGDGTVSVQRSNSILETVETNDFHFTLEPFEDELLKGEDTQGKSPHQISEPEVVSDAPSCSVVVDGHNAVVKLPVRRSSESSPDYKGPFDVILSFKLTIDDLDLEIKARIVVTL